MRVHICGVRGSTQAPGAEFVRVGGHTSCVALAHDDALEPSLILDAGTGIRRIWDLTGGVPFVGSILLGHLHWDHTHGLPFFRAGDDPASRIDLYLPAQDGRSAEELLAQSMSPPAFPIAPTDLRGDWRFLALEEGRLEIEGFEVLVCEIPHKGGRTLGFRISDGRSSLAYLSDHHPYSLGPGPHGFGPYHDAAIELCDGVDLLLHDAQYTDEDWATRSHFGHSTISYAVGLAEVANVEKLLLFHHDPARTDDEIDALTFRAAASSSRPVEAAVEGTVHLIGASAEAPGSAPARA